MTMPISTQSTIFNLPLGIKITGWLVPLNIIYIERNVTRCTG